jgi:hypothetical protein
MSTEVGGWPGFESRFEIPVFEAEQGERPDLSHNPT